MASWLARLSVNFLVFALRDRLFFFDDLGFRVDRSWSFLGFFGRSIVVTTIHGHWFNFVGTQLVQGGTRWRFDTASERGAALNKTAGKHTLVKVVFATRTRGDLVAAKTCGSASA